MKNKRLRKSRLDDDELVQLYATHSVNALAKLNGTSYVAVLHRLHRLGVKMRSRGMNGIREPWTKHGFAARALRLGMTPYRFIRLLTIRKLGGLCCRCGCADLRVLCLNHVNGVGIVRRNGSRDTQVTNKDCLAILAGEALGHLDVLCHNCNVLHEYHRGNIPAIPAKFYEEEVPE